MKLVNYHIISIFIVTGIIFTPAYADSLGRLYTSPSERKQLDRIRQAKEKPKPKMVEASQVEELMESLEIEKEIVIRDAIRLKGIVHRSDGKNAAWINESNTFEGNLETQFIRVPSSNINSDQATIIMPDDSTSVDLKVGEVFVPEPIEREIDAAVNTDDGG